MVGATRIGLIGALTAALFAVPAVAQDPADGPQLRLDQTYEIDQQWFLAADYAQSRIDGLRAQGADPATVRREECRIVRLQTLGNIHEQAAEGMAAALQGLSEFDPVTRQSCRVDQVTQLRQSARSREALEIAASTFAAVEGMGTDAPPELRARAASELALTLFARQRYDEARAMHERALALSLEAGEAGRELALRNRIALVDLAFQAGEISSQIASLETMLEGAVERYGETSPWVADILERLGGAEYSRGNLARGARIVELASAIRTPDPVGLLADEYRSYQIAYIMRLQSDIRSGAPVSGTYAIGGGLTPFMGVRLYYDTAHSDRIEVTSRHVASELAVLRNPNKDADAGSQFWGVIGAEEAHHASREALAGLIERIESNGVRQALPDRYNPLGRLSVGDVVFTHVDALWFDSHERQQMVEQPDDR